MATRSEKASKPNISVDDFVLLGGSWASSPGYWVAARVVYVSPKQICVQRWNQNGQSWLDVEDISCVRAHGTMAELNVIQDQARGACRELQHRVSDAESVLGIARDALQAKCAEFARGDLKIIPIDPEAIEENHKAIQDAINTGDEERLAAESTP